MSSSCPNALRAILARIIPGVYLSTIVLVAPGLVAQESTPKDKSKRQTTLTATPTPTLTAAPVCNWPPKDEQDKCRVIKAFVTALKQSTQTSTPEGKKFRENLLACNASNCTLPRFEVQTILDQNNPNEVKIPMVMFYFDPSIPNGGSKILPKGLPENGCYSVLSLPSDIIPPPETYWKDPVQVFEDHLRCCYPPWAPTVPCKW